MIVTPLPAPTTDLVIGRYRVCAEEQGFLCEEWGIANRDAAYKQRRLRAYFTIIQAPYHHFNLGLCTADANTKEIVSTIANTLNIELVNVQQRLAFRMLCLNDIWHKQVALITSLDRNVYNGQSPYNPHDVSYSALRHVVEQLEGLDLLLVLRGSHADKTRTKIITAGRLKDLLGQHLDKASRIKNLSPVIILKRDEGDKRLKQYAITRDVRKMAKDLEAINSFLATADITFDKADIPETLFNTFTDGQKDAIHKTLLLNRRIYRVFTYDLFHHGRFYGGFWGKLPSKSRSFIRLRQRPVIRIDFTSLHAHFLYILATGGPYRNPDAQDNAYDPHSHIINPVTGDCYDRILAKSAFNTMINCKTYQEAVGAVLRHDDLEPFGLDKEQVQHLVSAVLAYHKPIRDLFFDKEQQFSPSMELMYHDSTILFNALKQAVKDDVLILSIHDELITDDRHKDYLVELLSNCYFDYFSTIRTLEFGIEEIHNILHTVQ